MGENIEVIVIDWLNSFDDATDWPASGDKPGKPPSKYILVDRTGGPREAMVLDRSEILIEVYSKSSRLDASNKANEIADRLKELRDYHNITGTDVNSVVHLDDTLTQFNRYQVYCDINHRR